MEVLVGITISLLIGGGSTIIWRKGKLENNGKLTIKSEPYNKERDTKRVKEAQKITVHTKNQKDYSSKDVDVE